MFLRSPIFKVANKPRNKYAGYQPKYLIKSRKNRDLLHHTSDFNRHAAIRL
jgi:hypothetical protein